MYSIFLMIGHDSRSEAVLDNHGQSDALFNLSQGELASGRSEQRVGVGLESNSPSPQPLKARKHACNTAPHAFGGVCLEDVLKDCRKRVFGIEKLQTLGKSLLQAYLPVKRTLPPPASNQIQNQQEKSADESLGKRSVRGSAGWGSRPGSARGESEACESLSEFLGKSVKKLPLVEAERRCEEVLSRYQPVFQRRTGPAQGLGLEELLRPKSQAAQPRDSGQRPDPLSPGAEPDGRPDCPDLRLLQFNAELLVDKAAYTTLEDRVARAFEHRSSARCADCGLPLFSRLVLEKTKSLHCGLKLHVVDSPQQTCLPRFVQRNPRALDCPKCASQLLRLVDPAAVRD